ncbi:MAG TPA: hypothetical protein VNZ26_07905, partial [Vicinamibacterales bacterium]|nr:hypothetical protein [Vicinamibacterales bacterium]
TLVIPYSGTTCSVPVHGTETLHKPTPASTAPTPAPTPPPAPAPPPAPTPAPPAPPGGFNLSAVTILGSPDVRGWPITSQITSLVFSPGNLHIDHTKRGQWPPVVISSDGTTQESTIWVFFHINGVWYGTGGERLRPGQADKGLGGPSDIGPGWLYDPYRWGPMAGYVPQVGEIVGFMVAAGSTRSDNNVAVQERSSVVLIPFPADGITASFPPFAGQDDSVNSVATSLRALQPSSRRR